MFFLNQCTSENSLSPVIYSFIRAIKLNSTNISWTYVMYLPGNGLKFGKIPKSLPLRNSQPSRGAQCVQDPLWDLWKKEVTGWSPWKSEAEISMQEIQYYEYSWDQQLPKGRKGHRIGQRENWAVIQHQQRPQVILQGVLKLEWSFRVVLSWGKVVSLYIPVFITHWRHNYFP